MPLELRPIDLFSTDGLSSQLRVPQIVRRYHGHYKVEHFSCSEQFLTIGFAQLTYRKVCAISKPAPRPREAELSHLGIRAESLAIPSADANQVRDSQIYADFAQVLMRPSPAAFMPTKLGVELEQAVYAFDSTTIDLC